MSADPRKAGQIVVDPVWKDLKKKILKPGAPTWDFCANPSFGQRPAPLGGRPKTIACGSPGPHASGFALRPPGSPLTSRCNLRATGSLPTWMDAAPLFLRSTVVAGGSPGPPALPAVNRHPPAVSMSITVGTYQIRLTSPRTKGTHRSIP